MGMLNSLVIDGFLTEDPVSVEGENGEEGVSFFVKDTKRAQENIQKEPFFLKVFYSRRISFKLKKNCLVRIVGAIEGIESSEDDLFRCFIILKADEIEVLNAKDVN